MLCYDKMNINANAYIRAMLRVLIICVSCVAASVGYIGATTKLLFKRARKQYTFTHW